MIEIIEVIGIEIEIHMEETADIKDIKLNIIPQLVILEIIQIKVKIIEEVIMEEIIKLKTK